MKRTGALWEPLCSWRNLTEAARRAALAKKKRPDVAQYLLNLENELVKLRQTLLEENWQPGPYRSFRILEPKPRQISAAPFADRVVHHAFTQVVEPVFEKRFLDSSYACRQGFGTHRALSAARAAAARYPFVLQCDIRKYFATLDHQILLAELERVIKCKPTLRLAQAIVSGSDFPRESPDWYFPGDTLFTPAERQRGLPLGNQTSQFFANVYLNPLDHFVVRQIRPAVYARYVSSATLLSAVAKAIYVPSTDESIWTSPRVPSRLLPRNGLLRQASRIRMRKRAPLLSSLSRSWSAG